MVNSVGHKLQQARLAKQLSIEEAARVTRIRPDKLIDLEEDNYSNFPSMSYAKGFLVIYARFLGVDVRDFAETLHTPNPVSSDDYQYLSAAAAGPAPPISRRPYYFSRRRQHSILPVVVFGVLAGAVFLAIYLIVSFQRLGNLEDLSEKKDLSSPAASSAISTLPAAAPSASSAPVLRAAAPVYAAPPPALAAAPMVPAPPATVIPPSAGQAAPASTFDPSREVRRAEPIFPSPPAHAEASPPPPVGAGPAISSVVPTPSSSSVKRISILPIRKTRVTIRQDVADSAPIFEDWLYPGDGPLVLHGRKFWIQVADPGAVQVTQDGQPLPAGQSDIQIE